MAHDNSTIAHITYQQADGTTGILDIDDSESIHKDSGSVATADLADMAVTEPKLADAAVIGNKIADGAVTAAKIAPGSIGEDQLSSELRDSQSRKPRVVDTARVPISIQGGSRGTVTIPVSVPAGYMLIGVAGLGSTGAGVIAPVAWWADDESILTDWRNLSNGSVSYNVSAKALCIPV